MLDMGFIHDVRKILKWLPETEADPVLLRHHAQRRSRTWSTRLLHHPARVAVDPVSSPVEVIQQSAWPVDRENKTKLMVWILEQKNISSALVFTRTKHGADKVSRDLNRAGISAAAIHGNKSQTARQTALANFKSGKIRVSGGHRHRRPWHWTSRILPCVFNYNLPEVPETYVHRIGRTGRAGHDGTAFTLYDYGEQPLLKEVEKLMGKQVPEVEDHPWPMQRFEAPVRDKRGKIVNPEDQESRKAAREKRNARKAEAAKADAQMTPVLEPSVSAKKKSKKKEQAKPALTPKEVLPVTQPEELPTEPAAPVWSEEGEIPYYSLDLLPPRTEQMLDNSTPFDSKDILTRKYKRPARRVVPSLSRVSLLPGGELKETFSSRLRLEDTEPVLTQGKDATDRLLARKKPERRRKKNNEPSGKEKDSAKAKQTAQPSKAAAVTGEQKPKNSRKRRSGKKPSGAKAKPAAAVQIQQAKEPKVKRASPQKSGGKGAAPKANHAKRTKPPRPPQPISHSRQKDSTEQSSLMKPYYLSDLKKR